MSEITFEEAAARFYDNDSSGHNKPGSGDDQNANEPVNNSADRISDEDAANRLYGADAEESSLYERYYKGNKEEIDEMNADLQPLRSFILPGGSMGAATLHVARTVCRRAERLMVELASDPDEVVSDAALKYVNRLSDLLFVASRYANDSGAGDILWVPGQNR